MDIHKAPDMKNSANIYASVGQSDQYVDHKDNYPWRNGYQCDYIEATCPFTIVLCLYPISSDRTVPTLDKKYLYVNILAVLSCLVPWLTKSMQGLYKPSKAM